MFALLEGNFAKVIKWTENFTKQAVLEAATIILAPCKFTFDLLTLKVVAESRVTWATSANFSLPS